MPKKELQSLVEEQKILNRIYVVRGQKIMLDRRPCRNVWSRDKAVEKAGKTKRRSVPKRFYVRAFKERV